MVDNKVEIAQKIAMEIHKNQTYNEKPYYEAHIKPVAALSLEIAKAQGIVAEEDLQTIEICALLHDVVEDSYTVENAINAEQAIQEELNKIEDAFNKEIRDIVDLLTFRKGTEKSEYFRNISKSKFATIVKVADRCFNIAKLPDLKNKQKQEKLTNKYSTDMKYFTEFNLLPEVVEKELEEAKRKIGDKILKSKGEF